jgi:hypothetical protein
MQSLGPTASRYVENCRIAPRAVLRRREGTCFSSPSDDEVGGLQRRDPRGASGAIEIHSSSRLLSVGISI